jgi:hypothetical protein
MAHRKICYAITVTKSVLSMHLLNSVLQSLMTSEKGICIYSPMLAYGISLNKKIAEVALTHGPHPLRRNHVIIHSVYSPRF